MNKIELIDRTEVIEALEFSKTIRHMQANVPLIDEFIGILKDAPAIDAAPVRRGEWVTVGYDDQDEGMFFCSRCKDERWFGEEVHTSAEAARLCHYCPNCGADMRGEAE